MWHSLLRHKLRESIETMIRSVLVAAVMTTFTTNAAAVTRTDHSGDFLSTYTGPHNGDMDVLNISESIVGSNFVLSSTLAGPIGTTANAIYVWGVNRGAGTAGFGPSLGLDKVLFDSVVVLRPDATGLVKLLPGSATTLAAGSVTISGDTITGTIPISLLPTTGFTPAHYGFNLWPRLNGGGVVNISDFAPDNGTIQAVPEPASWAMMVAGFGLVGTAARRRSAALTT